MPAPPRYRRIIANAVSLLRPSHLAAFVTGDVRDSSSGIQHSLGSDTTTAFQGSASRKRKAFTHRIEGGVRRKYTGVMCSRARSIVALYYRSSISYQIR